MPCQNLRYNEVRQKSSHNSFQKQEGIYDQAVYWRIRSLEVDLHRGKTGRKKLNRDWYIYHFTGDSDTTVDLFSGFLKLCSGIQRAVPKHEVITVFLDIKDDFHKTAKASQSGNALDRLIVDSLGEKHIYRPRDLLARIAGAVSLKEAVKASGWPTLKELRGKFIFVLTGPTDKLGQYAYGDIANGRTCFVSYTISKLSEVAGPNHIVFYNMEANHVRLAEKVCNAGLVARVYGVNDNPNWTAVKRKQSHHIATDHVNARVSTWSHTSQNTGFPFESLSGQTPSVEEAAVVCGVWARSGDIWSNRDSFFYHYCDCSHHPDNEYVSFISNPNSAVDDCIKGGILARTSLAADSAYFGVFRLGEKRALRVQYRIKSGGSTIAEEKQIGPAGLFDADTLMFVKLKVSHGGLRASGWGSVDGKGWTQLGTWLFEDPLRYQGIGVSSHGAGRGAKFLFGIPGNRTRPPFNSQRFIGKKSDNDDGWYDWDGKRRWKVDRFAS